MTLGLILKALSVWFCILLLAVANGLLREAFLIPKLGQTPGLMISGILLSLLILCAAYLALPWLATGDVRHLIGIGVEWLILTLVFEFSFGLLQGKPLSLVLEAYSFKGGNLWPLVLLVTACAPLLAAKLKGWI